MFMDMSPVFLPSVAEMDSLPLMGSTFERLDYNMPEVVCQSDRIGAPDRTSRLGSNARLG